MTNGGLIGSRLRELREESKLTQGQMASFLSIDQSYIAKIEKGERNLNVELMEKLCSLFGCSEKYLLGESDKYIPLSFAFRSNSILSEDLDSIAAINKIALNLREIDSMLKGE